jgi:hypothetical protein
MLIYEFLCKREVLGKRVPHSFAPPPPPLSVVGVSNREGVPLFFIVSCPIVEKHTRQWYYVSIKEEEIFSSSHSSHNIKGNSTESASFFVLASFLY